MALGKAEPAASPYSPFPLSHPTAGHSAQKSPGSQGTSKDPFLLGPHCIRIPSALSGGAGTDAVSTPGPQLTKSPSTVVQAGVVPAVQPRMRAQGSQVSILSALSGGAGSEPGEHTDAAS